MASFLRNYHDFSKFGSWNGPFPIKKKNKFQEMFKDQRCLKMVFATHIRAAPPYLDHENRLPGWHPLHARLT